MGATPKGSNSNEKDAEIIRDLFGSTRKERKRALGRLYENWKIEFREYLWRAIEGEEDRRLQNEMVDFAIGKLKDRSLRKMIRFVEKDQLHPGSRQTLLRGYLNYETKKVRIALVKSLNRDRSQTYTFVGKILLDDRFWQRDEQYVDQFLRDILDEDNPNRYRKEFLGCILHRYIKSSYVRRYLLRIDFLDYIAENAFLHKIFLKNLFLKDNEESSDTKFELIPSIEPRTLVWEKWMWDNILTSPNQKNMISSDFRVPINHVMEYFSHDEVFLLQSISSRFEEVRYIAILILTNASIQTSYPRYNDAYLTNLNEIWNDLIDEGLDIELMKIEEFSEDQLEEILIQSERPILEKIRDSVVYQNLPAIILAYLPRRYLIRLAENDPSNENRMKAYKGLINADFWFSDGIIGPTRTWISIFSLGFRAIRFEEDDLIKEHVAHLLYMLARYLLNTKDEEYSNKLIDELSFLEKQFELIETNTFGNTILLKLKPLLTSQNHVFPAGMEGSEKIAELIMPDLLVDIEKDENRLTLENIIQTNSFEVKYALVKNLETYVDNRRIPSTQLEENNIRTLLEILKDDENVRIRTLSAHIETKIDQL